MTAAAPFYQAEAEGPEGYAHWIISDDGMRLRAALWPMEGALGTILMFPGRTEYVEKYGRTAAEAQAAGFAMAAIDWRGQGLSERILDDAAMGHVIEFMDYQLDVEALVRLVRTQGMPEPYFLVGHSMGGCIGLRALFEDLPVASAAFTGPMWGLEISPHVRPIAWALSWSVRLIGQGAWYAPGTGRTTYSTDAAFEENVLTTDRDFWDYMCRQKEAHPALMLGGPSLHWVYEALMECAHLARRPAPNIACVTFLGADESVVDAGPIHKRMAGWDNGDLIVIPQCRHEVLMEKAGTRALVWDRLRTHFGEFLTHSPVLQAPVEAQLAARRA